MLDADWADKFSDVVAVNGKALRRSFEDASGRWPTHLLQAFAHERLWGALCEVSGPCPTKTAHRLSASS